MGIRTLTIVAEADGKVTDANVVDKGMLEGAVDILAMPFGISAEDTEFVSKATAAYSTITWGVGLGLLGEAYGHKRERNGSQSFIPVFRG